MASPRKRRRLQPPPWEPGVVLRSVVACVQFITQQRKALNAVPESQRNHSYRTTRGFIFRKLFSQYAGTITPENATSEIGMRLMLDLAARQIMQHPTAEPIVLRKPGEDHNLELSFVPDERHHMVTGGLLFSEPRVVKSIVDNRSLPRMREPLMRLMVESVVVRNPFTLLGDLEILVRDGDNTREEWGCVERDGVILEFEESVTYPASWLYLHHYYAAYAEQYLPRDLVALVRAYV